MDQMSMEPVLAWAANAVGAGANVVAVESLHGGSSPWLLHIAHGGRTREVVLRAAGRTFPFQIATGAAALRVAEAHGLAAPRLLASDLAGRATGGIPATLETALPGSSASPAKVSAERLRAAGAAIAKVHKILLDPQPDLPLKRHSLQGPTQVDERPLERRWATLYRASSDREKAAIVALSELTGWGAERARRVLAGTHATPLLQLADDLLGTIPRPPGETVFLHADLWAGNMLWSGETKVTLIDWKDAGVGDPGVDLGHLRMKMATQYGLAAPAQVLDGWERERGRAATDVPYWDAVAALHTPVELDDWEPGFDEQGNRLDAPAVTARRDAFLRAALDRLERG